MVGSSESEKSSHPNQKSWVSCPYNSEHRMPNTRLQWHLVKCPDKKRFGEQYATCPYNATHKVLRSNLTEHKRKCPDKNSVGEFVEENEIDQQMKAFLASGAHKASQPTSSWEQEMKPQNPVGWVEEVCDNSLPPSQEPSWDSDPLCETTPNWDNPLPIVKKDSGNPPGWDEISPDPNSKSLKKKKQQIGAGGAATGKGKGGGTKGKEKPIVSQCEDFSIEEVIPETDEWKVVKKGKQIKTISPQPKPTQQTNQSQNNHQPKNEADRRKKALKKKLKEIEELERKKYLGQTLDGAQIEKINVKRCQNVLVQVFLCC